MKQTIPAGGIHRSIVLVAVLLMITGCDDNPVKPPPPAKDYVVWCEDCSGTGKYYGFHVGTDKIDSLFVTFHAGFNLHVSANGKRLYALDTEGTGVIDVENQSLVEVIPPEQYRPDHGIAFSPDGRFVAFQGPDLNILTYPDHALVYNDTSEVHAGYFTSDGNRFYCMGRDCKPRIVDMTNLTMDIRPSLAMNIDHLLPTSDESKWLMLQESSDDRGQFLVYDPVVDSILFREYLLPAGWSLTRTPDDRYAFYSLYAGPWSFSNVSSEFRVFDIGANRIERLISLVGVQDGLNPAGPNIGFLWVTPDGRWLFGEEIAEGAVFVVDLQTMKIVRYYKPEGELRFCLMAAQSGI